MGDTGDDGIGAIESAGTVLGAREMRMSFALLFLSHSAKWAF